jgi:hypothetical protein
MKYEWYIVLAVTAFSFVGFLFCNQNVTAFLGWMSFSYGLLMGFVVMGVGKRLSYERKKLGQNNSCAVLKKHRLYVAIMTCMVLVGVIGIEVAVRKVGGLWGDPWFIAFHLLCVVCMVSCFVLARFYFTGLINARRHHIFVYLYLGTFLATYITGTILISSKFPIFGTHLIH